MPENALAGPDVAEIAASSLAHPGRAGQTLTVLRRLVPFDGAWPASAAAYAHLAAGRVHRSFPRPVGGRHAPGGQLRITALTPAADLPVHLAGVVLVSPADDLHGLTPRELEVLGLLVGRSNREIARALDVAQRTVAATSSTSWSSS
jgi:Bacterial regulatory proteins, luxR family